VDGEEKRRQYLGIIVSESERLGALIENVLDFAKVERGKQAYDFVESNVADVIARAVEACRVRAERDQVALEYEAEPLLPVVRLDERAVEIAVINLVDNALKYAPEGKRVSVRVTRDRGKVKVAVADYGQGIPPEERKRIFERFVRGKSAAGKQTRGSGIGLALVKHIAEAHGGKVWVEDNVPRGSVFVMTMQAERGAALVGVESRELRAEV
jgi:two-component system phosphate regulon sensor histidine kinase PhoR